MFTVTKVLLGCTPLSVFISTDVLCHTRWYRGASLYPISAQLCFILESVGGPTVTATAAVCHGNIDSIAYRMAHRGEGVVGNCGFARERRQVLKAAAEDQNSRTCTMVLHICYFWMRTHTDLHVAATPHRSFNRIHVYLSPDVATLETMSLNHQSRHLAGSDISAKLLCQYIC